MGIENIVNPSTDNLGEVIDELTHGEGINVFLMAQECSLL